MLHIRRNMLCNVQYYVQMILKTVAQLINNKINFIYYVFSYNNKELENQNILINFVE